MNVSANAALKAARLLRAELEGLGPDREPGPRFAELLAAVSGLGAEEAGEILRALVGRIVQARALPYLRRLLHLEREFLSKNAFFYLDELNSALALLFEMGDIKAGFALLELMRTQSDARTLELLSRFMVQYRDPKVVSRLVGFREDAERRLVSYAKRLEAATLRPVVTCYERWAE